MLIHELVSGPLFTGAQDLPLRLDAWMCDVRPRFLAKGRVGQNYRAIARNGRVLLATDQPLAELADRAAQVRLQLWQRAILPRDPPEPYGILLCVRSKPLVPRCPSYTARLVTTPAISCALAIELGGGLVLEFQRNEVAKCKH